MKNITNIKSLRSISKQMHLTENERGLLPLIDRFKRTYEMILEILLIETSMLV